MFGQFILLAFFGVLILLFLFKSNLDTAQQPLVVHAVYSKIFVGAMQFNAMITLVVSRYPRISIWISDIPVFSEIDDDDREREEDDDPPFVSGQRSNAEDSCQDGNVKDDEVQAKGGYHGK